MRRLVLLLGLLLGFSALWIYFEEIPLLVIGQPTKTGKIQASMEEPFFKNLRTTSQIPFAITYRPIDLAGYKDTFQLKMLKDGVADLVSLRFPQNSIIEPSLTGIDLVGMIGDYETAKQVAGAYSGTIDKYLQKNSHAKLLGVWTFGPQEIFCNQPISKLASLKGLRVRTSSSSQSTFISELGGKPTILPFEDTRNALRDGVVDCAITSGASANFAGWPQFAKYNYPAQIQFGLNGYVISLAKWSRLSSSQQFRVQRAFDQYLRQLWQFTEILQRDIAQCNSGSNCKFGTRYKGSRIQLDPGDQPLIQEIFKSKILPGWKVDCDKVHVGCSHTWDAKVFPVLAQSGEQAIQK